MKENKIIKFKKRTIIVGFLIGIVVGLIIGAAIDASNSKRGKYGVITNSKGKYVATVINGERKPVIINCIVLGGLIGAAVGFVLSKKSIPQNEESQKGSENIWSDKEIADFLNGVKTGKIIPRSTGHNKDRTGRFTYFSFPVYNCEIHVHWKDSNREEMTVAHIKDISTQKILTKVVDTYTIAMLRYFSGLDNEKNK